MARVAAPLFSLRASGSLALGTTYRRRIGSPQAVQRRTSFPPLPQQFITQQGVYQTEITHWRNSPFTPADRQAWTRAGLYASPKTTGFNRAMTLYLSLGLSHVFHQNAFNGQVASGPPGQLSGSFHHPQVPGIGGNMVYGTDPRSLNTAVNAIGFVGDELLFSVTGLPPGQHWVTFFVNVIGFPLGGLGTYPIVVL